METNLITLKQIPIIEQQLQSVAGEVKRRTDEAVQMVVTEDTRADVKKIRAQLNGEFAEFENRRKALKAAIMAPYDAFMKTYDECVSGPYKAADAELAGKIKAVEDGLKTEKGERLRAYYDELRESLDIPPELAPIEKARINVTLSKSDKALREEAKAHLEGIAGDLRFISTQPDAAEIRAEYVLSGNLTAAMTAVEERHKRVEAQRERERIEAETRAAAEKIAATVRQAALTAPIQKKTDEKIYTARFTAHGTLEQLKRLKNYMIQEGIRYE